MSQITCPIECVREGCPDLDFLEKHNGFLITLIGAISGVLGVIFSYCIKSRCKNIKTPCISCDRDVVVLEPDQVEVATVPTV
jgi:hypothetical protein